MACWHSPWHRVAEPRLRMCASSWDSETLGAVVQELNTGLNLILSDEVLEMKGEGALKAMEAQCSGAVDENACAKAFEAAVAAGQAAF